MEANRAVAEPVPLTSEKSIGSVVDWPVRRKLITLRV